MKMVLELPPREEQLAFNRKRWEEVLRDPAFRDTRHRVETNAFGKIIMSPPPHSNHSDRTSRIMFKLHELIGGKSLPECPVSTVGGVRVPDVGWYSLERYRTVEGEAAFELAPEICIEVLSPDNTAGEMREKRDLYFEAGAKEFWTCDLENRMRFFLAESPDREMERSALCPGFPGEI